MAVEKALAMPDSMSIPRTSPAGRSKDAIRGACVQLRPELEPFVSEFQCDFDRDSVFAFTGERDVQAKTFDG